MRHGGAPTIGSPGIPSKDAEVEEARSQDFETFVLIALNGGDPQLSCKSRDGKGIIKGQVVEDNQVEFASSGIFSDLCQDSSDSPELETEISKTSLSSCRPQHVLETRSGQLT